MSFKDLMTYKRILIRHIHTSVISWWWSWYWCMCAWDVRGNSAVSEIAVPTVRDWMQTCAAHTVEQVSSSNDHHCNACYLVVPTPARDNLCALVQLRWASPLSRVARAPSCKWRITPLWGWGRGAAPAQRFFLHYTRIYQQLMMCKMFTNNRKS